jgi:uncharacterized membrane protein YfcA
MFLYLAIGLVAGVLSGIFGIGGGIVIVPALIYLAGFPPLSATGTSLGALAIPVGILVGSWTYYQGGHVNVRASLLIAVGLAVGAYFGAQLALHAGGLVVKRAFAVFLVAIAARMWFS